MNPADDLNRLWLAEGERERTDMHELTLRIQEADATFDRTIARRDRRERIAAYITTAVFLVFAMVAGPPLLRFAFLWLAASGLWIAFFLRRRREAEPTPEQTLLGYRDALLAKFDHQIKLLRTAKYWYILPAWIGLMLTVVAKRSVHPSPVDFAMAAFYTIFAVVVWYLNEVIGVRRLRAERDKLARVEVES